ncbi:hypothetical protein ACEUAI_08490 [Aeromonas veronii]
MTDFIMTMLMITLLNVLFGAAAFITLMFFIKKSEEKKKSKVVSELINGRIINIREYSMSMKDYLHIVEITPVISIIGKSIIETEAIPVYAKAKSKHGFSGRRPRLTRMKVRGNRHNATDSTLPDILVRNYQQTINDSGAQNTQFEFHRLTVPCG